MFRKFALALQAGRLSLVALVILPLLTYLFLTPASNAGPPVYGSKNRPSPEFERTTRLFTPDPYSSMPAGRSGKTVGIAIIPKLSERSDGAEKAIGELVGHIPAVSMVITLPPNDPLYLFKFLKYLKSTGRKVDFIMIAGHGLQTVEQRDSEVFGIKLGFDKSQYLTPAALDVVALEKEIGALSESGADPEKLKQLCKTQDIIYEGSSALLPGAQLVLHSCYAGNSDQTAMMRAFSTAFLGVNGGTAVGPKYAIQSEVLSNKDPQGVLDYIGATIKDRSLQIGKSFKSRRYIRPGDAFIDTQFYTELSVPANKIKVPACCGQDKEIWRKIVGLWRTDSGAHVRVSCSSSNELSAVFVSVPPNANMSPGDISFRRGVARSSNTVHTDNGYCYAKKKDNIPPNPGCQMDMTVSNDGKTVTGRKTLYQYYDGATTWDAGTYETSLSWTRIGD
ncbi:MAG: hypothetical protein K2X77_12135 [Candidatus Obscuribacterales bacterium]|jgi:hypothetical protein|nr:hypothetical protein [Candidatus Obscuribacterales bacterium]